ncbi:MAG: hypothetical protein WC220_01805 [Pedobacter sp.]|jgi:hypothetical protein
MKSRSFSARILFTLAFIFILSHSALSQKRRLINYTEISALIHGSTSLTDNSKLNGFRTRTGVSKLLDDHIGVGFALGTDNYRKTNGSNYNTLPITLNASYYVNPDLNGLKLDAYGGYAVKLFNNLSKGMTAGAGLSYSFSVNGGLNLGIQTGYNYQKIDYPAGFVLDNSFDISSIRLGLGITFK